MPCPFTLLDQLKEAGFSETKKEGVYFRPLDTYGKQTLTLTEQDTRVGVKLAVQRADGATVLANERSFHCVESALSWASDHAEAQREDVATTSMAHYRDGWEPQAKAAEGGVLSLKCETVVGFGGWKGDDPFFITQAMDISKDNGGYTVRVSGVGPTGTEYEDFVPDLPSLDTAKRVGMGLGERQYDKACDRWYGMELMDGTYLPARLPGGWHVSVDDTDWECPIRYTREVGQRVIQEIEMQPLDQELREVTLTVKAYAGDPKQDLAKALGSPLPANLAGADGATPLAPGAALKLGLALATEHLAQGIEALEEGRFTKQAAPKKDRGGR